MPAFTRLVRFESQEHDGKSFFSDLGAETQLPEPGTKLAGHKSIEALLSGNAPSETVTVKRVS